MKKRHFVMRTTIPACITFVLFAGATAFFLLPKLRQVFMNRKKEMLRSMTEVVISHLQHYQDRVVAGELDLATAQKMAAADISRLRYGPEGKDYFWVNDLEPRMIMHPYRTDLNGRSLKEFADPNGKRLFVEMVRVVREDGSGYVDYAWQWKDDSQRIVPKISFVKAFEPWGWVVGTGMYVQDVEDKLAAITGHVLIGFGTILLAVALLLGYIVRRAMISYKGRERAENELKNLRNYLSDIINSMPSVLIGVDPKLVVTQWNRRAEVATGVSAATAMGKPLIDVFSRLGSKQEDIREAMADCTVRESLREPHEVEGKMQYEDITIYPLLAGGIEGAVIRVDDVTAEHRLQEQLHQSRKLDAIGQLAGGVAHDFNNMLSGILGAAELLQKLDDEEKRRKFLNIIIESAGRAADLTDKLLAFARKGSLVSAPVNAHEAVMGAVSLLERSIDKRVSIRVELNASQSTVIGELGQLENAFLNLGINASHAMPNGGELSFTSRNIELNEAYCKASTFELKPGRYFEVEIRDTGHGIPHDQISHIFEPFFTTKEQGKGTGLGLAAVYGTVQQHNGAIAVYSEEGRGTAFHIALPLADAPAEDSGTHDAQPVHGHGRILIIDDESAVRATSEATLCDLGYDVILAEDGAHGLEIFRQESQTIDLVILDMVMPKMNGAECFAALKEIDPDVRVILSSGFSRDADVEELKNDGLLGFVRKPVHSVELSHVVAEAMAAGQSNLLADRDQGDVEG